MLKSLVLLAAAGWLSAANLAGCAGASALNAGQARATSGSGAAVKKTLRAFRSEQELADYFRRVAEAQKREMERRRAVARKAAGNVAGTAAPSAAPAPAQEYSAVAADAKAKSEDDQITNVQHAGVDEGGIVKVRGEHLVVLRRGRLFTVEIGGNALRPISAVDAFGPDIDPRHAGTSSWPSEKLSTGTRSSATSPAETSARHIPSPAPSARTSTFKCRSSLSRKEN